MLAMVLSACSLGGCGLSGFDLDKLQEQLQQAVQEKENAVVTGGSNPGTALQERTETAASPEESADTGESGNTVTDGSGTSGGTATISESGTTSESDTASSSSTSGGNGTESGNSTASGSGAASSSSTANSGNTTASGSSTANSGNSTASSSTSSGGSSASVSTVAIEGGASILLADKEYEIRATHPYDLDFGFSEGLAWTEYVGIDGFEGLGVINEAGELLFSADIDDILDFFGEGGLQNLKYRDGLTALYSANSYMILDDKGNILSSKQQTERTSYRMLSYGYGEFLVWKEDGNESGRHPRGRDCLYTVDAYGNPTREPMAVDGGFMSSQRMTCLGKGVFTDGIFFCDLENRIYKDLNANLAFELDHWARQYPVCDCDQCYIFNHYPAARTFAYYDDDMGYEDHDPVYMLEGYENGGWYYHFYHQDGTPLFTLGDTLCGREIYKIGYYSGGYVPVQLEGEPGTIYVTLVNVSTGEAMYEPLVDGVYYLFPTATYHGYMAYENYSDENVMIVTPEGKIHCTGDDLSGLGENASMYANQACFLSGGYFFGMNSDIAHTWLINAKGEEMEDCYISVDGKKVIDRVHETADTGHIDQLGPDYQYRSVYLDEFFATSLGRSCYEFDGDLARTTAIMSELSEYSLTALTDYYSQCGLEDNESYDYDFSLFDGGASAFGSGRLKINGVDTDVLVITCRGSTTIGEFIGDWLKGGSNSFLGTSVFHNDYDFEEKVWAGLKDYLDKHPSLRTSEHLKIVVTGHSLGGAAANMVGARIDSAIASGTFLNPNLRKDDVYVYTYGAIKVLTGSTNLSGGYGNIHNLYNQLDSFGPRGNYAAFEASMPAAKFGHTELFILDEEEGMTTSENHHMFTYWDAINIYEVYKPFINTGCR